MSHGVATGTRPRRDSKRPVHVVVGGAVALGMVAVVAWVGLRAPSGLPLRDYRTLFVSLADAGNLQPRNDARISGARVGQVIAVRPRAGRAVAELQLEPGTEPLSTDTRARLRARGLLGARYVELVPGRSGSTLADRALIRAHDDALTFGVPETLETFDAHTRGALGEDLRALGTALLGRGQELNLTLQAGPRPARQFPRLIAGVLAREGAAERFAPSLRAGSTALDTAREDLAAGMADTGDAVTAIADRRDALARSIDEAPGTLRDADRGLGEGRALIRSTAELARAAKDVLPVAPSGLEQTVALLRESRVPLDRAQRLLQVTRPAVDPTLLLTRRLSPLLGPLRDAFDDLVPLVSTLGRYGCDIDNFAENWRSALGYGVELPDGGARIPSGRIGPLHNFRILAFSGAQSVHDVSGGPADVAAERDPYPRPCRYSPGSEYPLFVADSPPRRTAR